MRVLLSSHTGWGSCLLACLPQDWQAARYVPCGSLGYWKGFFPTFYQRLDDAIKTFSPDVMLADNEDAGAFLLTGQSYGLKIIGHPIQRVLARDWEFVEELLTRAGLLRVPLDGFHKRPDGRFLLQFHQGLDVKEIVARGKDLVRMYDMGATRVLDITGHMFTITGFFTGTEWVEHAVLSNEQRLPTHHEVVHSLDAHPLSIQSKLFKVTLGKLTTFLKSVQYTGPLGMRCVLQDDGKARVVDLVPRWPEVLTEVLVYATPIERLIARLAGWTDEPWPGLPGVRRGRRVTIRPYPVETGAEIPLSIGMRLPSAPPGIVWGQVAEYATGLETSGPRIGVAVAETYEAADAAAQQLLGGLEVVDNDQPLSYLRSAGLIA